MCLWRRTRLPHLVEGSADLGEDHLDLHVYLFGLLETRNSFGAKVPGNFLTRDSHMTTITTGIATCITSFSSASHDHAAKLDSYRISVSMSCVSSRDGGDGVQEQASCPAK